MDESALKILLANLDKSQSSLHGWLYFWTFLVGAGVALEVFFVVWEYVEQLHDFRRGFVHPPERPNTLLFVLGLLGAGLVAVGVAGELYVDVQADKVETEIRNANDLRISLLTKEAGDAKVSAEAAALAASRAATSADTVQKQADALTDGLTFASKKLDEIEQVTLAQGPRWRLLERGEDVFVKALQPFAGQQLTVVACGNDDAERIGLEQLLGKMFSEAGWNSLGRGWAGCPNTLLGGNEIFFVAGIADSADWAGVPAQQRAIVVCGRFNRSHDAGNTLCDVLNKLRIPTTAWRRNTFLEK